MVTLLQMVRSISDPLEHLVNQVEIRHRPSYLANGIFCKQFKEREIHYKTGIS